MTKLSKRVGELPGYPMAELPAIKRRLLQRGVDIIDVGAGDADFAPPEAAVEALVRAAADPAMSRYAFQLGLPAFRESAARYLKRRFDLAIDPFTELHPLLGSKEGIAHLALAVLDPGDLAIVPEPGYAVYHGGTVLAGATPHLVPLTPRTDFLLELEELPADVVRRARLVYLTNEAHLGDFGVGDSVSCLGPDGREFARGLVNYSAAEVDRIKGAHSRDIARLLGYKGSDEVIHRDDLVLLAPAQRQS